jgi:hypothetical protein
MASVAYLVFTFLACVLGVGIGLILHRARLARRAAAGLGEPDLAKGDEEQRWDTISRWQAEENRVFASFVAVSASVPLAMAAVGWSSREHVVGGICSGLSSVALHSPLCL